jgi:hypothetical protein
MAGPLNNAGGVPQMRPAPDTTAGMGGGEAMAGAPVEETMGGDVNGEAATPEEQAAYDKTVTAGIAAIFEDDKIHNGLVEQLKSGASNPPQTLAMATNQIMGILDDKSGNKIPEEVIIPAAAEILENIGELAQASGAFQVDEGTLAQAAHNMLAQVAEDYDITPTDIGELMDGVDEGMLNQINSQQGGYYG